MALGDWFLEVRRKSILGHRERRYWLRRPSPVRLKMALASGCEQRSAAKLAFADR